MKFKSEKEILAFIKKNNIQMIDVKVVNLFGGLHHLTMPVGRIENKILTIGEGFDASSIPGFSTVEKGDMRMLLDWDSAFIDPYSETETLSFFAKITSREMKKTFKRDPRHIAAKADSVLRKYKIADRSLWGPELEFYVFSSRKVTNRPNACGFEILFYENEMARTGYHASPPFDKLFDFRNNVVQKLESAGHKVRYHHHEVGYAGQLEIEPVLGEIVESGDTAVLCKYFVRNEAERTGLVSTFMPKPISSMPGSGMHFHILLEKKGRNIFSGNGYAGLSRVAINFLCGILLHSPALLALTNPSTNSYKRLVPGYEAPTNIFFSFGNRSAAIRIPGYITEASLKRFEFRPPDASCNAYIAMAAILLAGIDGAVRKLRPETYGFGPFDENVFNWSEKKRNIIHPLPTSLADALEALDRDRKFLVRDGVFDDELIDFWIQTKREEEKELSRLPHPWEIDKYFNV